MSETPESAPAEGEIDFRNNQESKAAQRDVAPSISRANEGGAVPRDAPLAGEAPEEEQGGVASGNPVSGVSISEEDLGDAVKADK